MHIKICGITNKKDALHAVREGASHIGLIFVAASPRRADRKEARSIINALAKKALVVGVFQNQSAEEIIEIALETEIDMIQLHGDENADFCREITSRLERPIIKTIIVESSEEAGQEALTQKLQNKLSPFLAPDAPVSYLLFDRIKGDKNPEWLADALLQIASLKKDRLTWPPYFFAGGLNAGNLAEIFKAIKPDGVDIASGVEVSPGIKDPTLVSAFIDGAKTIQGVLRSTK